MAFSGCDDNVGTWLTEYRAPLVGFVLPIVNGDFQAAEDLVQETMHYSGIARPACGQQGQPAA